ncbi:TetR/AcrR family transcriptional regulator [Caldibacillus debilis]|uniref:TetR/AcrR family transcriptional regulator n=1 Tax=Caldibacillus debilis TaxID=301148 RepID=UPI000B55C2C7|nr:TetR/AcrR family transcriptional regulator [Caldibacillus debilis]OUM84591.1 MAG: TetR family transcriptional regulator [Caldibacillus debilis]
MIANHERYRDILTAGRKVLAEKGFENTKVSDIVERAGVAKGTFYLYFPSKFDLVLALAQDMRQQILSEAKLASAGKKNSREALAAAISAAFRAMSNFRDIFPVFNAISAFSTDRWEAEKEIRIPYYLFLRQLIEEGQKSGEFRSDLNPAVTSRLIAGMVEHAAHECFVYHSPIAVEDYLDHIRKLIDALFNRDSDAGGQSAL